MEEITFSVFNHGAAAQQNLQLLLDKFEEQYGIHVRLDVTQLSSLRWPRLVEAALYHSGPDVSEVGNSWVGDLVRMDALRPFSKDELSEIMKWGQPFDVLLKGSTRIDQGVPTVYSTPLSADARAVFYRRDLLGKAGLDEANAFIDIPHFIRTLEIMRDRGISTPLVIPNRLSNMTLHCCASWVWSEGGNLLSPDENNVVFDQPGALEGFKAYFRLVRHLAPEARDLEEHESDAVFCEGNAAILLGGYWIPLQRMTEEVRSNLGAAQMPGVPFVGGGNTVVWNHSRHELAALKLVQFCQSKEAGKLLYPGFGLPIREADWSGPSFDTQIYHVLKDAIKSGRGFPSARLWGLVEKRLADTLADIWAEVLITPESQLDSIVEDRLRSLAQRLQLQMGAG